MVRIDVLVGAEVAHVLFDERDTIVWIGLGVRGVSVKRDHIWVGDHGFQLFSDLSRGGIECTAHTETCFFFLTSFRLF